MQSKESKSSQTALKQHNNQSIDRSAEISNHGSVGESLQSYYSAHTDPGARCNDTVESPSKKSQSQGSSLPEAAVKRKQQEKKGKDIEKQQRPTSDCSNHWEIIHQNLQHFGALPVDDRLTSLYNEYIRCTRKLRIYAHRETNWSHVSSALGGNRELSRRKLRLSIARCNNRLDAVKRELYDTWERLLEQHRMVDEATSETASSNDSSDDSDSSHAFQEGNARQIDSIPFAREQDVLETHQTAPFIESSITPRMPILCQFWMKRRSKRI